MTSAEVIEAMGHRTTSAANLAAVLGETSRAVSTKLTWMRGQGLVRCEGQRPVMWTVVR